MKELSSAETFQIYFETFLFRFQIRDKSFLDALASLDFKLSVSGPGMFLQLAHLRVFQIYFIFACFQ